MTDVIPDCLFIRDFEAEKAGGYVLAGMLFVRRRPHELENKTPQIARIIQGLTAAVRENRDLDRMVGNLDGSAGLPIDDKLRDDEWLDRHYAPPDSPHTNIAVRVDPRHDDGYLHLSDYDLKQIMGSH